MSEKNFWTLIRNNLPLKMYRVENRVAQGMPDVHYIGNGKSGWIELKYINKWPKRRFAFMLENFSTDHLKNILWKCPLGANKEI